MKKLPLVITVNAAFSRLRASLRCVMVLCCAALAYAQYAPASFSKNPLLLGVPVDLTVPAPPVVFQGTDDNISLPSTRIFSPTAFE
jgi:hypothetical protein